MVPRTCREAGVREAGRRESDHPLIRNDRNVGNCGCRNKGLLAASGRILCVVDADCCLSPNFVSSACRRARRRRRRNVCIGPMGIEGQGRDIQALHGAFAAAPDKALKEMRLQFQRGADRLRQHGDPKLLDHLGIPGQAWRAGCSTKPFPTALTPTPASAGRTSRWATGCTGWGPRSASAAPPFPSHKTHPPEVSDQEKAPRSTKNFLKLMRKHPELSLAAPDWAHSTLPEDHGLAGPLRHLRGGGA
ncbi:hypothetical protein TSH58p_18505 (plasmid) [Azospirillum sp. TSH58]|nr:hypothetical protein TSH58p_18505 [Azospirillum sp. TSH58]